MPKHSKSVSAINSHAKHGLQNPLECPLGVLLNKNTKKGTNYILMPLSKCLEHIRSTVTYALFKISVGWQVVGLLAAVISG